MLYIWFLAIYGVFTGAYGLGDWFIMLLAFLILVDEK